MLDFFSCQDACKLLLLRSSFLYLSALEFERFEGWKWSNCRYSLKLVTLPGVGHSGVVPCFILSSLLSLHPASFWFLALMTLGSSISIMSCLQSRGCSRSIELMSQMWLFPVDLSSRFLLFVFPPTISATWCEGQKSSLLQRTAAVAPWGCQLSQIFLSLSFPTDIATTLIVSLNVLKENFPLS